MLRFLYYKGFVDLLDINMLHELRKDVNKDYKEGLIEEHQYNHLKERIYNKINNTNKNKIAYI